MAYGIEYTATETASMFHHDDDSVRLLFGPVGCGKSVACCLEILGRALRQNPGRDGIRRSRWAVIRNTYPELKTTTINTWRAWYPEEDCGKIKFDSPISQHIKIHDVDLEVIFLALDSEEDVKKLMSLELTGVYINELQYINKQIFNVCRQRVNRYPSKKDGAEISWSGVIADTNPPDNDHWIYKTFEENPPAGFKIYKYPSPLTKIAEAPLNGEFAISTTGGIYINNHVDYRSVQNDPNYWIKLVPGSTDEEIKVNLMGQYGVVITGKPVHASYNDQLHYSGKILVPNEKIPLGFGLDFGLTPAIAITQLDPSGQFRVIDEVWSEDMNLRDFLLNAVIPHLNRHYPWWRDHYESRHDPAGETGAQTDGNTCSSILKDAGIISLPAADNNDPTARRDGLGYFLGRMTGGQPAFQVSSKCRMVRKGLMGGFQYARMKTGGETRYHEKPLKNIYSHICEALEYIAMFYAMGYRKPKQAEVKPYKIHRGSFLSM